MEGRLRFSATQVDAFARLLALRMVNARALILEEERRQHLESLATSFLLKLAEVPHSIRIFDLSDPGTPEHPSNELHAPEY